MASKAGISAAILAAQLLGLGGTIGAATWYMYGAPQKTIFGTMDPNIVEGKGHGGPPPSGEHCTTMVDDRAVLEYIKQHTGVDVAPKHVVAIENVVMAKMERFVKADGEFVMSAVPPGKLSKMMQKRLWKQRASRPFVHMLKMVLLGKEFEEDRVDALLKKEPMTMIMFENMISKEIVDLFGTATIPTIFAVMDAKVVQEKALAETDPSTGAQPAMMDEKAVSSYFSKYKKVTVEPGAVVAMEALVNAKMARVVEGCGKFVMTYDEVKGGEFFATSDGTGPPVHMIPGGMLDMALVPARDPAPQPSKPFELMLTQALRNKGCGPADVEALLKKNPKTVKMYEYSISMDMMDVFTEVLARTPPSATRNLFQQKPTAKPEYLQMVCKIESLAK